MRCKDIFLLSLLMILASCGAKRQMPGHEASLLRAPAYPLVTIDPYISAWSAADRLYDAPVTHWTGKPLGLIGVLDVDGQAYRFMGASHDSYIPIVKSGWASPWDASYTMDDPGEGWISTDFDDSKWEHGQGPFGNRNTNEMVQTEWLTKDIWVRRWVNLSADDIADTLYLEATTNLTADFYINGNPGYKRIRRGCSDMFAIPPELLHEGDNLIAVVCHSRTLAYLDFGICRRQAVEQKHPVTAVQTLADVQAMNTYYTFDCGPVELELVFTAPLFLDRPNLVARPVNYISYRLNSKDGQSHVMSISFEASEDWALHAPWIEQAEIEEVRRKGLTAVKVSNKVQNVLGQVGDGTKINWGSFYLAGKSSDYRIDSLCISRNLGKKKSSEGYLMLGYDDVRAVEYFGEKLLPYWNRDGKRDILDEFASAEREYKGLMREAAEFDASLMDEATKAGGRKYAELCALAYRQAVSAHMLAEAPNGDMLWLSKENNSNGSIGTVDITYPSAPMFLHYNPEFVKGMMNPIFYYSESGKWQFPFPAHDVGTYPRANGQTYGAQTGGGYSHMPVEESGNMLILTAAVCKYEGSYEYAAKHWDVLGTWAEYLLQNGLDPENQLCTDDFAGHFAHNANLSIKAILAIASYGKMASALGHGDIAEKYENAAREMASKWQEMAFDGNHYRLTFDKPGTWSQKYNLVWDRLLGLNVFDAEIARTELAYYPSVQNRYGIPLDNRANYTKTDWIVWTATMADSQEEFEALVNPVWDFMNETVDRVPMSDWVFTDTPHHKEFIARSVVGGYFIKILN